MTCVMQITPVVLREPRLSLIVASDGFPRFVADDLSFHVFFAPNKPLRQCFWWRFWGRTGFRANRIVQRQKQRLWPIVLERCPLIKADQQQDTERDHLYVDHLDLLSREHNANSGLQNLYHDPGQNRNLFRKIIDMPITIAWIYFDSKCFELVGIDFICHSPISGSTNHCRMTFGKV